MITTAQVPGRRAPLLVTEEAVNGMKRGAMIVDLAGTTGGNCALSKPDETVERNGVTILAPTNLPRLCRSMPANSIRATSLRF